MPTPQCFPLCCIFAIARSHVGACALHVPSLRHVRVALEVENLKPSLQDANLHWFPAHQGKGEEWTCACVCAACVYVCVHVCVHVCAACVHVCACVHARVVAPLKPSHRPVVSPFSSVSAEQTGAAEAEGKGIG